MWARYAPVLTRTLGDTDAHPGRGEQVTLRRPGSLEDVNADVTPRQLKVAADAVSGATSLILALGSGGRLSGTLPKGARLTVGAQTLTTTTSVTAPAAAVSISVTFAPALLGPVAADTVVLLEPDEVHLLEDCHVTRRTQRDLSRPLHADNMALVTVPSASLPAGLRPRLNDSLQLEDGTVGRVAAVPVATAGFYKLQMGGG